MPGRDVDNVDAAANLEGLTEEQRDELSDRIHEEKRCDRRDLTFSEIRRMAREIKLEYEGEEIEARPEESERTQTRGEKHLREEMVAREKESEGRGELRETTEASGRPFRVFDFDPKDKSELREKREGINDDSDRA